MQIFTTAVGSDDGKIYTVDTIDHEGAFWLVPHWTIPPGEGVRRPTRMIRLDRSAMLPAPPGYPQDWVLQTPVPKAVLFGETPPEEAHGFEVVDRPDISLPWTGGSQH